jgi:Zn-dependent protease
MRDLAVWSLGFGRWWHVHLRIHFLFLCFSALLVYLGSIPQAMGPAPAWAGIAFVMILLVSVLLHEIGHVVATRRLGGIADEIVLGPLGGLSGVRVPFEPQQELLALLAGPLVSCFLCICVGGLLALSHQLKPGSFLVWNPLMSTSLTSGEPLLVVGRLLFWVNWSLALVNLTPAFPFDGGRILRAALTFFWPEVDHKAATLIVARLSMALAVLTLIGACLTITSESHTTWFALTLLSLFVLFSARREEQQCLNPEAGDEGVFGYDFSQGYTSLERSVESRAARTDVNTIARWIDRRREMREQRQRELEAAEDLQVDEILARLHQHGIESLSEQDQAVLQRVSQRYRSRPG